MNTLSSSPLLASREYVAGQLGDLADKLEQAEAALSQSARIGGMGGLLGIPVRRGRPSDGAAFRFSASRAFSLLDQTA